MDKGTDKASLLKKLNGRFRCFIGTINANIKISTFQKINYNLIFIKKKIGFRKKFRYDYKVLSD